MVANYNAEPLLEVNGLKQYFQVSRTYAVRAVDDVSFQIWPGETYSLVGESGSGKSTIGRAVIRLYHPTAGTVQFNGMDISGKMSRQTEKNLRRQMQMIFQDPMASLNPRKTIGDIIGEGLDIHHSCQNAGEREARIKEMLRKVGLDPEHHSRYPHQFSGGQRQRVGIARALMMNPKLIIADECISALDVSIQAQVVNMFEDLQKERGLTYLFIAHDLSIVNHISNRIGVMYLGRMVELAESGEIIFRPLHPYTKSLISAIPVADPKVSRERSRIVLEGEVPSPLNPPSGCHFRTRCKYATEQCAMEVPKWREVEKGHFVACHNIERIN